MHEVATRKSRMAHSPVWLVVLAVVAAIRPLSAFEVVPVELVGDAGALRIPCVTGDDASWYAGSPTMNVTNKDISAKGWIAITRDDLLFHVEVVDPEHNNEYHERNLWRGDCIYISVDGRGDTTPEMLESRVYEDDDGAFTFGLGAEGAEVIVGKQGRTGVTVERIRNRIVRDDEKKTTVYDMALPLDLIGTAFGQSPTIGVAIHIAHKNVDKQDTPWGTMRTGGGKVRTLNMLAYDTGDESFATISPKRVRLIDESKQAVVTIAVRARQGAMLLCSLGAQQSHLDLDPSDHLSRIAVRVDLSDIEPGGDTLRIDVNSKEEVLKMVRNIELSTPEVVMNRFRERIEKLRQSTPNDLVRDHLDSTLMVAEGVYRQIPMEQRKHPDRVEDFVNTVEHIQSLMPEDSYDWNIHVRQCVPIVLAFVSEFDRSLQFYSLQLPFDWKPDRTYPLTIYLHGHVGDINPVSGLTTSFDNSHQDTLFRRVDIDPNSIPPSHRGYVLAPWGRGNSGYKHSGEDDVWDAIRDAQARFRIDEDRMYMTGFSMGCHGAWSIAARTPDRWAGVNLASGFGDWSDTNLEYLDGNARGLPVVIWIGALDGMVEGAKEMAARLRGKGFNVEERVIDNLPHTYPYDQYQESVGWLMQYRRQKSARFSFVVDTSEQIGRNGIYMVTGRHFHPDRLPQFTCEIKGNDVHLDSSNTEALLVVAGEGGLGLSGDIRVIWNGEEAYQGPVDVVNLGEEISSGMRRWLLNRR